MSSASATVFVVDDDPGARESLAALVRSHGLQVETFDSAETFLSTFDRAKVGCLVSDVRMPGMSGLQLQRRLAAERIALPAILITAYGDVPMAVDAMRAGAFTFLEKPCEEEDLLRNIHAALQRVQSKRALQQQREQIQGRLNELTADERDVLTLLLQGEPNKRVAATLDIGLRTVELRRSRIMKKMHAASLAQLVRMAMIAEFLAPTPNQ